MYSDDLKLLSCRDGRHIDVVTLVDPVSPDDKAHAYSNVRDILFCCFFLVTNFARDGRPGIRSLMSSHWFHTFYSVRVKVRLLPTGSLVISRLLSVNIRQIRYSLSGDLHKPGIFHEVGKSTGYPKKWKKKVRKHFFVFFHQLDPTYAGFVPLFWKAIIILLKYLP